jgi:hypothetical protein
MAIETPQILIGTLTGTDTLLLEPADRLPALVPLVPLPPPDAPDPDPPPEPLAVVAVPWQLDWAPPSSATARPQTSAPMFSGTCT